MPAPHGTLVDINTLIKRLGRLKLQLQRDKMSVAKTLSADILTDLTAVDTDIQAATTMADLSADPTLSLTENP